MVKYLILAILLVSNSFADCKVDDICFVQMGDQGISGRLISKNAQEIEVDVFGSSIRVERKNITAMRSSEENQKKKVQESSNTRLNKSIHLGSSFSPSVSLMNPGYMYFHQFYYLVSGFGFAPHKNLNLNVGTSLFTLSDDTFMLNLGAKVGGRLTSFWEWAAGSQVFLAEGHGDSEDIVLPHIGTRFFSGGWSLSVNYHRVFRFNTKEKYPTDVVGAEPIFTTEDKNEYLNATLSLTKDWRNILLVDFLSAELTKEPFFGVGYRRVGKYLSTSFHVVYIGPNTFWSFIPYLDLRVHW